MPSNFEFILSFIDDAVFILHENGTILSVNTAAERLFGIEKTSITGMEVNQFFEQNNIFSMGSSFDSFKDLVSGKKKTQESVTLTLESPEYGLFFIRFVKVDDALVLFLKTESSPPANNLYWESLEKMWESQKSSINIMESIPSAIFICKQRKGLKHQLVILDCNPAAEAIAKKPLAEIQGRPISDVWKQAGEREIEEKLLAVANGGKATVIQYEKMSDEGKMVAAYNVSLFALPQRQVGFIFDDITELKKAEFLLEQETIRLKQIDELKSNFIAITSHELKTPLVSTCGAAEFLLSHYQQSLGEKELSLVKLINNGSNRLKRLVNSLLDMSRLETGGLRIERNENDITALVKSTIEDLSYRIMQRDLKMSTSLPDKLVFDFDPIRIEQVIVNLITNAIKNTPPGGHISVIVRPPDHHVKDVELIVKDTGIGILKEEMDKLFIKFGKLSREEQDVDIQGTGLGLYISKEILTIHGGSIWVESGGRNQGSAFHVTLPFVHGSGDNATDGN